MSYRTRSQSETHIIESSPAPFTDECFKREMMILRDTVNWEDVPERRKFVHQFYNLILDYCGRVPDLQAIFRPELLERLLLDCTDYISFRYFDDTLFTVGQVVMKFVSLSGYRHEPRVDKHGKPLLKRITPLHHLISYPDPQLVNYLFRIYDKYEANYINEETGITHFHVACTTGRVDIVRQFLELGHVDPNLLVPETRNTPLHYAIAYCNRPVVELLLKCGGNPHSVNVDGSTALHVACRSTSDDAVPRMLFEFSDERHRPIQVDARDNLHNTSLHLALRYAKLGMDVVELLLRRGADPNSADATGSTPLHCICKKSVLNKGDFLYQFIKIAQLQNHKLQFDARDNAGWTPLQWAVSSFDPKAVRVLLKHGADLSQFIFPTDLLSCFGTEIDPRNSNYKLLLVSRALATIEILERQGYELDRPDAVTIMKYFVDYELIEKTTDVDKSWCSDESFIRQAKTMWVRPNLSLHDLIQLRPRKEAKLLSFMDYHKLSCNVNFWMILSDKHRRACILHLCEMMSKRFFSSWTVEWFYLLIHCRLPLECCYMILEELKNEDMYRICLAHVGQRLDRL
uniref:Uncharacterized protein n=1 Tax=Trichogramma kaykai TaxID=54128 RepID=A0ABD2XL56_9HYME